jgi:dienelactone hydrolase
MAFSKLSSISLLLISIASVAQVPAPRVVDLSVADGTVLKGTYFAAARPGPGVLLLHQCDQDRKIWGGLPEKMAAKGIHVLTVDNRGYGESGGVPHDKLTPQEAQTIVTEKWPGDFDTAYEFLTKQPGVKSAVMGAGGASCGVNNAIKLARRHPEVKALMLLSGPTDRNGRLFLQKSEGIPVFVAAAEDDQYQSFPVDMQWLFTLSSNPASRFQWYATGRHGGEMFGPHPELMDMIADWFVATLMEQPSLLTKTNGSRFDPVVASALVQMEQPEGVAEATKKLAELQAKDPKLGLSEAIVNTLGYEHILAKDAKGAVEIMKLNVRSYPKSPNAYDSLADAYVATGEKELAAENARKALVLLASDTKDDEARKKLIRESAEQKLKDGKP